MKISNPIGDSSLNGDNGLKLKSFLNSEFKNPAIPKTIFGFAIFIAIFFLAFKAPADPDLFWHLKTGELMWQYKIIPHIDWYSHTMSDFSWIDHEWLTEILMFKIKDALGWAGLSVFFAAIITFIFTYLVPRISKKPGEKNYPFYITSLIALLGTAVSSSAFGARPQILALLGISLVFFVLKYYQLNESANRQNEPNSAASHGIFRRHNKIIYALPVIFLLWANMHASFAIGIGLLIIYLLLDKYLSLAASRNPNANWLELYKPLPVPSWKKAAYVAILSLAATFINPYGPRIYIEIYRTFSDFYGTNAIIEWLSPNFHATEGMLFGFFVIFAFIILALIKKIDMLSFVLIPLFLFLAFQSARNIPLFVLIAMPFLIKSLNGFENAFTEIMRKKFILLGVSALLIIYPPYFSGIADTIKSFSDEEKLAEIGSFPKKAIDFLENYPAFYQKNIFNNYAWGGYMINSLKCKVESKKLNINSNERINTKKEMQCTPKVFIDGRMAHWKTDKHHILKDYAEIENLSEKYEELINEYRIKIIFTEKDGYLGRALVFNSQWKKIYSDDIAVIYEKVE